MEHIEKNLIHEQKTISDALQKINDISDHFTHEPLALFVVNDDHQVIGSLTDGDIRRNLLKNKGLDEAVHSFMNPNFQFLRQNAFTLDEVAQFRKKNISLAPILDYQNRMVKIIDLTRKKTVLPVDAFVMAGGKGTRLRPLTENTPKPLLKVGDKPILEYNIDRCVKYGIENLYISVNYLGNQIKEYFGDGSSKGIHIHYVEETRPLGTLGSLSLIDKFSQNHILLMNSDLLTTIDLEYFYRDFIKSGADMSVASVPYEVRIPYAILDVNGDGIESLNEKPEYTYHSNAGIYFLKCELLNRIPKNEFMDVTDFMEGMIRDGRKISFFPILGYWLDIGKHEDFDKAKKDIRLLEI